MDKAQHVKIVAWIYIVLGSLAVLAGICTVAGGGLAGFSGAGAAATAEEAAGAGVFGAIMGVLGFVYLIIGALEVFAGWGLLKYRPWSRTLAIVLSAIMLIGIPIGTIIGAYALWVLLNDDTKRLFGGGGVPPVQTY